MIVFFVLVVTPTWDKINNSGALAIFIASGTGLINFVLIPTWIISLILWKSYKKDKNRKMFERW